ncbi:MAG: DapH/DapD/GlmU-related protein [Bacteroidota bacterium]
MGNNIKIDFPVKVEGKGKITIGNNVTLRKNVELGIANSATLNINDDTTIDKNVVIKIGSDSSLNIGKRSIIEMGTRLFINNKWEWGNDVMIATNCNFFSREQGYFGKLTLGNGTHIGDNTIIDISDNILIGNEVAIGPNCVLYAHDHVYDVHDKAAWMGGIKTGPITIGDGAWIASGVTIMPGITIGKKSVIAAGAVVTSDVPELCIYGGVPARLIKKIE